MTTNERFETQRLDHLGLVAGISQEIGLVDLINERVGASERQVSSGHAVLAMVLNALGFSGRALYLMPDYLRNKPVDVLLGPALSADDFNDDTLGRTLDDLYAAGVTEVFAHIASRALQVHEIEHQFVHLDSSSFHLHGAYDQDPPAPDSQVIEVTHGYSRDHRPDLKQVVAQLITSQKSALPVWLEVLSGNSSDKTSFPKSVNAYCEQLGAAAQPYFVMDSAGYSAANLHAMRDVFWLTRVPETLAEAQVVVQDTPRAELTELKPGYWGQVIQARYAAIPQRWLLVYSEAAYEREAATLTKAEARELTQATQAWHKLCQTQYQCAADAESAAQQFNQRWQYHQATAQVEPVTRHARRGRPAATAQPAIVAYQLTGPVAAVPAALAHAKQRLGKFILATNQRDPTLLPATVMLENYTAQGAAVERSFRFLKDPMFFAHSLFLKKPERLMALVMIMTLALLIYALAERQLRQALQQTAATVPNQKGQPTATPTIRWIFQVFEGIDVLIRWCEDQIVSRQIINLRPIHIQILRLFGPLIQKCYGLGP